MLAMQNYNRALSGRDYFCYNNIDNFYTKAMTQEERLWRVVQLSAEIYPKMLELKQLMGEAELPTESPVVSDAPKKERKKWTRRVKTENEPEAPRKKFSKKPCCGSEGPRHKADCDNQVVMGKDVRIKELTFGLMVFKCLACGYCFKYKGSKLDAICPECKSTKVYTSSEKPDTDTIYEPGLV